MNSSSCDVFANIFHQNLIKVLSSLVHWFGYLNILMLKISHVMMTKYIELASSLFAVTFSSRAGGSVDTELDRIHLHLDTPCQKAKKGSLFGSLERGMNRMICMLTPKKRLGSCDEPRKVKVSANATSIALYHV